jgi:hypothetical protein
VRIARHASLTIFDSAETEKEKHLKYKTNTPTNNMGKWKTA